MANYNDKSSKYYYDPAVQLQMADDMDKWIREQKEQKPAPSPKEDYLEKIQKSPYGSGVHDELAWRFAHPGDKNSPAYTGYKSTKVSFIHYLMIIFMVAGVATVFGGCIFLPEFKNRDVILFAIFLVFFFAAAVCMVKTPRSTYRHFTCKKVYRLSNKIWRRRDAKRYLGRK